VARLGMALSSVFVAALDQPEARARLGDFMAGASGQAAESAAFHRAYQVVMGVCAACAVLSGIIGGFTAPGRVQKPA
jgi:hypothetical protein